MFDSSYICLVVEFLVNFNYAVPLIIGLIITNIIIIAAIKLTTIKLAVWAISITLNASQETFSLLQKLLNKSC